MLEGVESMTILKNKSKAKEKKSKKNPEKKSFFIAMSELGEYFTRSFILAAKFLGLCFMYFIATLVEVFSVVKKPIVNFLNKIGVEIMNPINRLRKAHKLGTSEIERAQEENNFEKVLSARLKVFGRMVFGKRGVLVTVVNWCLPVVCFIFLFNVIGYANNQNYAVKLTVNGDFVGYISNENTFTDAEKMVQNRINYTGSNAEVFSFEPTYQIENIGNGTLLNQYQVADKMLSYLGKEVKEGFGLYLGTSYYGTLESHDKLDEALQGILDKYSAGLSKETVQFDRQVSYVHGTYLADSFVNEDAIIKQFTSNKKNAQYYSVKSSDDLESVLKSANITESELDELNPEMNGINAGDRLKIAEAEPFLSVIVTREEHYTETFDFDISYVDDATTYAGNKLRKTPGERGERAVVANVSYINGNEISRSVLSTRITKDPVTEVWAVGTKPRTNTTAPGQTIADGIMLWPVGGIDGGQISTMVWWHGGYDGHDGIDIVAPFGTPVYAAENGVVTAAVSDFGWNGGRGNYIIIQGDSGYRTYYYHNNDIFAYVGQRVTAGDLIATIGLTGWTTGYHLHFGVNVGGGNWLNPLDYLPWHKRASWCVEY